jgi:RNA polymerase sigma-70 factor (ECF subfamily)
MALNSLGRQKQAISTEPEILEATCVQIAPPDEAAIADEAKQQLRAGMSRLGKLDRKTLEAFYFEGQSLVEMAETFDAPVGTIKRRLHVARKRLAQQLEPTMSA